MPQKVVGSLKMETELHKPNLLKRSNIISLKFPTRQPKKETAKADSAQRVRKNTIELEGGVTIECDQDGNLKIKGAKSLNIVTEGELKLKGDTVNIQAKRDLYLGSETSVLQSKTVHLNPLKGKTGYGKRRSALRRTQTRRR